MNLSPLVSEYANTSRQFLIQRLLCKIKNAPSSNELWNPTLYKLSSSKGFSGGSGIKNPPANTGDPGSVHGWEDPLEMERAIHFSILTWEIPWTGSLSGYSPWGGHKNQLPNNKLQYTQHSCLLTLFTQEGWGSYKGKPLLIARGCTLRLFFPHTLSPRILKSLESHLYFYILRKRGYLICFRSRMQLVCDQSSMGPKGGDGHFPSLCSSHLNFELSSTETQPGHQNLTS